MNELVFCPEYEDEHLPDNIKIRSRLHSLAEVEEYLIKACKEKDIALCYDLTADERSNWMNLNYTSYNGMLIICPLSYDPSLWQMYDALRDDLEPIGHIDLIKNNINNKTHGKYVFSNTDEELEQVTTKSFKNICILPGHNKFNFVSKPKIQCIVDAYGKDLIFKYHPVTDMKMMEENGFISYIDKCQTADKDSDMYTLIEKADKVYTTHISETALSALVMGKTVAPIDVYNQRMYGGFSHINHFCFTDKNPVETLGKIFASPKSGVIHPVVDKDWKKKIDLYLEYVLEKRESQNGFYFE